MEPVIKRPEKLAKERLTSKVRYQRNIDLIAALKSGNRSMVAAIEYMKKGFLWMIQREFCLMPGENNTASKEKDAMMMITGRCCNRPEVNRAFRHNQDHQLAHICSRYTTSSGYR